MTRLDVNGVGYTEASALLHDGNVWAAYCFDRLSDALLDTAAMAGDSSFADRWAAEYDAAAAAALDSFAQAIIALGNLGRLAFASWENHTRAELASTFGSVRIVDEVGLGTPDWVEVVVLAPPSSLGGDPSSLPGWATVILDHVEGFVWPDADLDRLRRAAEAWRSAGDGLDDVASYPGRAITTLWTECSPEILPATAAIGRLKLGVDDLAAQCRAIAGLCDDYAVAVEEQRAAVLDLVKDLLVEAAVIQAAGFALGLLSFGTANGGAVALNLAKIAAESPRFLRLLDFLRRYADETAEALAGTRVALAGVGTRLRPMTDTRLLMSAEVGQVGAKATKVSKVTSFLGRHEGGPMGAHTLERHVGKTDDYLRERLRADPRKTFVSTFTDEAAAERGIETVLALRRNKLEGFMISKKQMTAFEAPVSNAGRVMGRDGSIGVGHNVHVNLVKDATLPEGFRIITAFVKP